MLLALVALLFLPVLVVSVGLAALPWRPMWLRLCVLTVHLAATVAAVVLLPGRFDIWMMVLGPGAAVAVVRGLEALGAVRGDEEGISTAESGIAGD